MTHLLAWAWENQALELANFSFEYLNKTDLHPNKFTGQSVPIYRVSVNKQSRFWDYHLGTAEMNSVFHDPYAGCCKPLSISPS